MAAIAKEKELNAKLSQLYNAKGAASKKLGSIQHLHREGHDKLDAARRQARLAILNEASIILTTLSGRYEPILPHLSPYAFLTLSPPNTIQSGYEIFLQLRNRFETVVIDEAAQVPSPTNNVLSGHSHTNLY